MATDEAHALFIEVADIFKRLTSPQKTVSNIKNLGGSHIRLAVVPSLGLHVAPLAIMRFRRQHVDEATDFRPFAPAIRFKVECVYLEHRPPSQAAEQFIAMLASTLREMREPRA